MGFSHNTPQHHLERLATQSFVVREKAASNGLGRPRFACHVPSRTIKQVTAAIEDPYAELIALRFSRLSSRGGNRSFYITIPFRILWIADKTPLTLLILRETNACVPPERQDMFGRLWNVLSEQVVASFDDFLKVSWLIGFTLLRS